MPDFSVILQSPQIRAVVQDNLLEKAFHDSLFPRLLFRGEVAPVPWPGGIGDTQIFSAPGLMAKSARPLVPGQDPTPISYSMEQWSATIQQYSGTVDTHMPTSMVAIANMFLRNAQQLGLQSAQTLNSVVRNRMFAAGLSGWTTVLGAQTSTTSVHVNRLNGFTRARNPNTAGASTVKFDLVSATNPLGIHIFDNGSDATRNVVGFTPDNPGDEYGPGFITLNSAITSVADRAYVYANDSTAITRVGGGNSIESLGAGDIPTLADIRTTVSTFWQQNVPEHPDGRFHAHIDPLSTALIFKDTEFQRLLTALPDYFIYKEFAIGELLNTVFYRNTEMPIGGAGTVTGDNVYSLDDPFPGELYVGGTTAGVKVHRILFTAQGGIMEYFQDYSEQLTEAGMIGTTADPHIVNNGIEVFSDRIQFVIRAPLNRLQDLVSTSWRFKGDWPVRTDAAAGSAPRYKRFAVIEHVES